MDGRCRWPTTPGRPSCPFIMMLYNIVIVKVIVTLWMAGADGGGHRGALRVGAARLSAPRLLRQHVQRPPGYCTAATITIIVIIIIAITC